MQVKEILKKVTEAAGPICEAQGVSLWDVTFEKEGRSYGLTVIIDREEGVFIEDCEKVSRALDPVLDGKEFASMPNYTLTVSSPGLERKLNKPEHFEWALGKAVEVSFYKSENGVQSVVGELLAKTEAGVKLALPEGETEIPQEKIAAVHIHFDFE
jgi:ribosome maturation factor RimP